VVDLGLAQSGLSPEAAQTRITESIFLAETEANLAILHQLRELASAFRWDDFPPAIPA